MPSCPSVLLYVVARFMIRHTSDLKARLLIIVAAALLAIGFAQNFIAALASLAR